MEKPHGTREKGVNNSTVNLFISRGLKFIMLEKAFAFRIIILLVHDCDVH
jgi:hypothetical protein